MARHEPETCTLELATGSFVHVACTPSDAVNLRAEAADEHPVNPMQPFMRVAGAPSGGWQQVWIDVRAIVAVYPIHTRPEPSTQRSILAPMGLVPGEA